jgi:TPR repeat protein
MTVLQKFVYRSKLGQNSTVFGFTGYKMKHKLLQLSALLLLIYALPGQAGMQEARVALQNGDYETVLREIKPLAAQGDADAQNFLGTLYETGEGIQQDFTQAAEWYSKSAQQGYAKAQTNLGFLYEKGKGVPQDNTQAIHWIAKAAEQGLAVAQESLGYFFSTGLGVEKDYAQALRWFRLSAEQDVAGAQYNLGIIYENGLGVNRDREQALFWYRKAAGQGLTKANNAIAALSNQGSPKDESTAPAVLEESAPFYIDDPMAAKQAKNKAILNDLESQARLCMTKQIKTDLQDGNDNSKELALHAAETCGEAIAGHFTNTLKQPARRAQDYILSMAYDQLKKVTNPISR